MNRYSKLRWVLKIGFALSLAGPLLAQGTPDKTLIVNGKTVSAAVMQIEGRSYVDIEALAQGTDGSVSFEPNQIVLTIPGSTPTPLPPEATEAMSKEFQRIAIATLAEMREWRGAIGTVISSGMPVVGTWPQDYRDRVEEGLLQATLGASTDSDKKALQLLRNEDAQLSGWADNVVTDRQTLNAARTIDPNSLKNDQVLAKISNCGQFLSSMIVSGIFSDDLSCH